MSTTEQKTTVQTSARLRQYYRAEVVPTMMSEFGYKCMAEHIARALVVNVFSRRASDLAAAQVAGRASASHGQPATGVVQAPPAGLPNVPVNGTAK